MADMLETERRASAPSGEIRVIMNAGSGKRRGSAQARELEAAFAEREAEISLRLIESGADLEREARRAVEDGCAVAAAAGGDGTINAVASALAKAATGLKGEAVADPPALGVVPLGTFNYVARSLGIPEDPVAALDVLTHGRVRPLPLGLVNDKVFLNNASLGAYAKILETREVIYHRYGRSRAAAHWSAVKALADFRTPLNARVTVDGRVLRVRTPLAFIANNAFQLEQFAFHDAARRVEDGEFALFLAPDCAPVQLMAFAAALSFGRLKAGRDFELHFGREILVETGRRARLVARDGERSRMRGPYRFQRRDDALKVMVPQRSAPLAPDGPQA